MKIAFYGGTFDPVHLQHTAIARYVIESGRADRLVFLPAPVPPHKDAEHSVTAYSHRRAMLELALRNDPELEISDFETLRSGKSYTIESMKLLSQIHPNDSILWLIGSDSLRTIHTWYHAGELVDQFRFLTYPRPGEPISETELAEHWTTEQIRRLMDGVLSGAPQMDISSTAVRHNLQNGTGSVEYQLDPEVYRYIKEHKLYIKTNTR